MDKYLVYGNPIKQSRSPFIHQSFAKNTKQNLSYHSELVEYNEFKERVNYFISCGGLGANVTAPFKEQAMELCDHLSELAKLSGAVNTLTFKKGQIFGDTTDGIGLVNDLLAHKVKLKNQRILLIGAGGAAKGVVLPLLNQKIIHLTIANRTVEKAQVIVEQYPEHPVSACTFAQANLESFDIIINATSAGLKGQDIPISDDIITKNTICYDMTYGKELTPFLEKAKSLHAKQIIDGLGMLVGQAAESFYIWRGVRPSIDNVLMQLRKELS